MNTGEGWDINSHLSPQYQTKGSEPMKVRMLRTVTMAAPPAVYKAGQAYELPSAVATGWAAVGLCELDKMSVGPPETKTETARPKTKAARRPNGD